jgi:hypothetical protein
LDKQNDTIKVEEKASGIRSSSAVEKSEGILIILFLSVRIPQFILPFIAVVVG